MASTKPNLVLIGFMGAGKSTVGPPLAKALQYDYVDTDQEIEKSAGLSIPEIFSKFGETFFRECETKVLKILAQNTSTVISAGGGAPINNGPLLKSLGLSVYLKADPKELVQRLDVENRPILQNLKGEALDSRIATLLAERTPHYQQADMIVDTTSKNIETIVSEIIERTTP